MNLRCRFVEGHEASGEWEGCFSNPIAVDFARSLDEVEPLIQRAEQASLDANWVVLVVSYAAAAAFDQAISSNKPPPKIYAASLVYANKEKDSQFFANQQSRTHTTFSPAIDYPSYAKSIRLIRRRIAAGDCYQVNYTFPLYAPYNTNAMGWFEHLHTIQSVPYSAYIELGDITLLSLSPELFFRRSGRKITCKPMKGTAGTGSKAIESLKLSKKDQAENLMIVDLLRNDLSRIAELGSVRVNELFKIDSFSTISQMSSTISATCRGNSNLVDQFRALFPCGSITGAPKIKALEIIDQLESAPRDFYTGALGLLRPGGDAIFNVLIRTIQLNLLKGIARYDCGSGITYDSSEAVEYQECLLKCAMLGDINS